MSGKLLVIDGGDGAGKATQVALLVKRLQEDGYKVETLDFPQYTQNTFGKLLRQCLDGKRGDFMAVDPRIASTIFAADRFESKPRIAQWLAEDKIVILDRYVSANMMHQGAKLDDVEAIESFLGWLDHMEHEIFNLPRPDQIVYLEVPNDIRVKLKADAVAANKHGVGVELDVAERNVEHQQSTEERARQIVAERNEWGRVVCTDADGMRSREAIHEDVYNIIKSRLA